VEQAETNLIAIMGSPRRGGNSDTLAREFLKGAVAAGARPKALIPTDLGLSPCDGDNRCFTDGRCVIRDGMNGIYDQILAATYLVIATPVYFMGPPGSLKSFIDRFQAVWARGAVLRTFDPDNAEHRGNHKMFAIYVGAVSDKPNYYRPAVSIVKTFSNVIGFTYSGEIIATGLDRPDDAEKRTDLLGQALEAGRAFVG
jgi:multimeric flavodoxin WrbA